MIILRTDRQTNGVGERRRGVVSLPGLNLHQRIPWSPSAFKSYLEGPRRKMLGPYLAGPKVDLHKVRRKMVIAQFPSKTENWNHLSLYVVGSSWKPPRWGWTSSKVRRPECEVGLQNLPYVWPSWLTFSLCVPLFFVCNMNYHGCLPHGLWEGTAYELTSRTRNT